MLSGRGLCDELITRPEESYRLWCVVVCDLENLKNEEAMTRVGSQRHSKKKRSRKHIKDICIKANLNVKEEIKSNSIFFGSAFSMKNFSKRHISPSFFHGAPYQ